ncbi:Nitroreductase [Sphingobium herbicidovorans NBRC 16415]|uniref:Nitroreductase n=1 Tax=Sphingobium herbicidovorans (strain ATCC 700291 / DSM 11019 / CCUG 56400 / KCTC 2939 / LMG 18315 / NBRC 16415 / MH) TaxID=1219045 RepID=A0A086PC10_SPHHM|nr:nitroreductase [Sphingobium herbicidovorans]KFG90928.1 Nitroreductase [Sphingobium herbicidovorans NBRC 16415]
MEQIDRKPLDTDQGKWTEESAVLSRLLAERYSCRSYRPEPVSRPEIERMLEIAQMSASWCNSQPWQVIVTEGAGTERLRQLLFDQAAADAAASGGPVFAPDFPFPTAYRGVYKERQREVGWQLYESVGIAFGDRVASGRQVLENFRLFGAPNALIVTSPRDLGTYGAIDCGLYVGSLLLAAQSLGLGMIPQAALAIYGPLIHEHFNVPDDRMVVLGASFGYPDEAHPANSFRSRRASIADAVEWVSQ